MHEPDDQAAGPIDTGGADPLRPDAPSSTGDALISGQWLRRIADDILVRQELRRLAYLEGEGRPTTTLSDTRLNALLTGWVANGRLDIAALGPAPLAVSAADGTAAEQEAEPEAATSTEASGAPPAAEQPTETPTRWIRFRVIDDETQAPVPGARFRIKAPGRGVREYVTDAEGVVYIDALPDGSCDIEAMDDDQALEVVNVV
jgi:hypothetical protein